MKTLSLLAASAIVLLASTARANDPAAAEALFRDGRTLLSQGNYAEACAKLEESERLDPAIGTLYHLADCHEHMGKLATAWAELLDVSAQAKQLGQHEREAAARQRADALAPRLPHMVLDGVAPRGAEIRRDATVVGPAEMGARIPVNPGLHKVTVRAPGTVAWETTVVAIEGGTLHVRLPESLTALPVAATPTPAVATPANANANANQPSADARVATPVAQRQAEHGNVQRNVGIVIAGAGLVGLGVGSYFGVHSMDKRGEARSHCTGNVCDADGLSLRGDAISAGNVSTVTFIAGGAALVGGGILFFTAPPSQETAGQSALVQLPPPPRARLVSASPWAGPFGGGVALTGEFQ